MRTLLLTTVAGSWLLLAGCPPSGDQKPVVEPITHIKPLEKPCDPGVLRTRHAYSEKDANGCWHVVEDDTYSCPPEGSLRTFRVWDMATTQPPCPAGSPPPVRAGLKDLHGDTSCQAPRDLGEIMIDECIDGIVEHATYELYECPDLTKRISVPAKNVTRTTTPCGR